MKALYCAQVENDGLSLRTLSGTQVKRIPRNARILVSRLDCDLRILDVPPLPARDIRAFIRYRLRAYYPGNPDGTVFDFRLVGEGAERRAIVHLMTRETLEQYRLYARRGRLVAADQLLAAVLKRDGDGAVLFVRRAYAEYLRYADGELDESSMALANGHLDLPVSCRRAQNEGTQTSADRPVWVTERHDDPRIQSALGESRQAERPSVRSLEEALAAVHLVPWARSRMGLFRNRRLTSVPPHLIALALAILTLALTGLHIRWEVDGYEQRYEQARSAYLRSQARYETDDGSRQRLTELRARYESLAARRPIDVYGLLCTLSDAAAEGSQKTRTTIDVVTLNGTTLTVEGSASDPFGLAEKLSSGTGFSQVRIMQAVPASDGRRVRFTMTAGYDDR